jgi:uncharacterized protein (DUF427 family)
MIHHLEDREISPTVDRATVVVEPTERRVRAFLGGQPIADSRRVLVAFEPRRLPVYYFPMADVRVELLQPAATRDRRQQLDARVGDRAVAEIGWILPDPDPAHVRLRDHVAFYWAKVDAWFEEDEEVFVHPRDPYKRVDVLPSSRHVRVVVDGETIAETHRPVLLFETGLPTRYYIPRLDVRLDLLEPSATITQCPYKGRAVYWSVRADGTLHPDLVWSYPFPIAECPKIEKLMAFFNEKLDIYDDGELRPRPRTQWS